MGKDPWEVSSAKPGYYAKRWCVITSIHLNVASILAAVTSSMPPFTSIYLHLPPFAFILLRFTSIQPRFASIRLHFTAICIYFRLKRMNFYIKPPLEDYDEHVDSIGRNQGMPWEMYDL